MVEYKEARHELQRIYSGDMSIDDFIRTYATVFDGATLIRMAIEHNEYLQDDIEDSGKYITEGDYVDLIKRTGRYNDGT